jgi:hypothetical protein
MSSEELRLFAKVRIYLDEDFSSAEHFTVSVFFCIKLVKCCCSLPMIMKLYPPTYLLFMC